MAAATSARSSASPRTNARGSGAGPLADRDINVDCISTTDPSQFDGFADGVGAQPFRNRADRLPRVAYPCGDYNAHHQARFRRRPIRIYADEDDPARLAG